MTHQERIKELRQAQREIEPLLKSSDASIRATAAARMLELGRAIDAEFLRHERSAISII